MAKGRRLDSNELLAWLRERWPQHGFPSTAEIQDAWDLKTPNDVQRHLDYLVAQGHIWRTRRPYRGKWRYVYALPSRPDERAGVAQG